MLDQVSWLCRLEYRNGKPYLSHDLSQLAPVQAAPVIEYLRSHCPQDTFTDAWARDLRIPFATATVQRAVRYGRTVPVSVRLSDRHNARLTRLGNGSPSAGLARLMAEKSRQIAVDTVPQRYTYRPDGTERMRTYYLSGDAKALLREYGGKGRGAITTAIRFLIDGRKQQ
jgi:hypothetical protein